MTKHGLKNHSIVPHERKVCFSVKTHNYASLAIGSKRDILCCTHQNGAKEPQADRNFESNVICATFSGDQGGVRNAPTEIFDSQVLDKTYLSLDEKDGDCSFSSL